MAKKLAKAQMGKIVSNKASNIAEKQKFQKSTNDRLKTKPQIKAQPKKTMQQELLNPTRNFAKKGGVIKAKKK